MVQSLLDTLKAKVLGDDRRQFTYECQECGMEFESPTAHMAEVSCRECGSNNLRAVAD